MRTWVTQLALLLVFSAHNIPLSAVENTAIQFRVTDADGKFLPCRIHLRDAAGRIQKAKNLPSWSDHFVCSGQATVSVAAGRYTWEIERGPEYQRASGSTRVAAGQVAETKVELTRIAMLRGEGWYSGDLHVHRDAADVQLLMSAEDLDFAPMIQWWNQPAPNATPLSQTEYRFAERGLLSRSRRR